MTAFKTAAEAFYSDPAKLPCGCNAAQAKFSSRCVCNPDWLNAKGECERECRACEVTWTGERTQVSNAMIEHVRTDEHARIYADRQFELRQEDQERQLQLAGMLF